MKTNPYDLSINKSARHFPDFLSLVTAKQLTPVPALVFLCSLSLCYLTTSDVYM